MRRFLTIGSAIILFAGVSATLVAAGHKTAPSRQPIGIDTYELTLATKNLPVVEVREPF